MQTPPVRLPLPPGTTAHQLMAQGMPESSAYRILKQGWYCPGYNHRDYPQHDGAGGFAILETPERFVWAYVLRTLALWEIAPSPELVEDLTQEGLLACWTRRHAPHIQNFPRYYAAMLRGLVTQHCKRLLRVRWCTSSLRLILFPRKPSTMPPRSRHMKGVRHDSTPIFLPNDGLGTPLDLFHVASCLAQSMPCNPAETSGAHPATAYTLQRAASGCRSPPQAPVCRV